MNMRELVCLLEKWRHIHAGLEERDRFPFHSPRSFKSLKSSGSEWPHVVVVFVPTAPFMTFALLLKPSRVARSSLQSDPHFSYLTVFADVEFGFCDLVEERLEIVWCLSWSR